MDTELNRKEARLMDVLEGVMNFTDAMSEFLETTDPTQFEGLGIVELREAVREAITSLEAEYRFG